MSASSLFRRCLVVAFSCFLTAVGFEMPLPDRRGPRSACQRKNARSTRTLTDPTGGLTSGAIVWRLNKIKQAAKRSARSRQCRIRSLPLSDNSKFNCNYRNALKRNNQLLQYAYPHQTYRDAGYRPSNCHGVSSQIHAFPPFASMFGDD